MKKIDIDFCGWGDSWHVGTLADNGVDLLFEYADSAIRRRVELSPLKLALQSGAYYGFPAYQHRLPGIFADSIPDGWGLLLMDRLFERMGYDRRQISPLDRLAFLGSNAIGAFSFRPSNQEKLCSEELSLLDLAKEIQHVVADADNSALKKLALLGGSPQGARPKVLVQYDKDQRIVSNDPNAPGAPWMIKFQSASEHKEVCAIEHAYAHMARLCRLDMPDTEYFDLDKNLSGFGIARFDRENGLRVPTNTLAGILDLDIRTPGISYNDLLRATRFVTKSIAEVKKTFERCVFNIVFNNQDDHAKNFSYRMNEKFEWRLAPCYDMTFSFGPGGEHQMDVRGAARIIGKSHLLELAAANDIRKNDACEIIDRISSVAGTLDEELKNFKIRAKTRQEIAQAVEANRLRMADAIPK